MAQFEDPQTSQYSKNQPRMNSETHNNVAVQFQNLTKLIHHTAFKQSN